MGSEPSCRAAFGPLCATQNRECCRSLLERGHWDGTRMLGGTVLVLTEPGNELLSVQLPSASSIQPIKEELQLLCAAWEILLLQLLRIKEIRKKKHPVIRIPVVPSFTCMSERVMNPVWSLWCPWMKSCTFCMTLDSHSGSSLGPESLQSCLRRLEPMRRPLAPARCSAMAHSWVLQRGEPVITEPHQ